MGHVDKNEFAGNDGKEGKKAYVAFEGKVYDVTGSKLWSNGVHLKTHFAGRDLTLAMKAAPHGPEVLERFELVADLVEEKAAALGPTAMKIPSRIVAWVLSQHPHPVSVHFPIALSLIAALFTVLSLYVPGVYLQRAALYNILVAALVAPASIAIGVLSWYYNYSGIWTHIYRMKTLFSIILVVLYVVALTMRFGFLSGTENSGLYYWIYTFAVLATGPTVMLLGYYGGKITFPS